MSNFIGLRRYTYAASLALGVLAVWAIAHYGLNFGIDFTGGTRMEVGCAVADCTRPDRGAMQTALETTDVRSLSLQETDRGSVVVRYVASDETQNEAVRAAIAGLGGGVGILDEKFMGSSISGQLRDKAINAVIIASVVIALFIAWSFRAVSFLVPSWAYGVCAVVALLHDLLLMVGAFAFLGYYAQAEIDIPFVAALLTILGYSINDTIVVYDRVRENLLRHRAGKSFEEIVNMSVGETLARSVNSSMTVIIVLVAIALFGGHALFYFALALLIGVVSGTYSSIYVASALLVTVYNRAYRRTV